MIAVSRHSIKQDLIAYGENDLTKQIDQLSDDYVNRIGEFAAKHIGQCRYISKHITLGAFEFIEGEKRTPKRKTRDSSVYDITEPEPKENVITRILNRLTFMRNLFFLVLILILIFEACKKADINNSGFNGESCKMLTFSQTQNGNTYNIINYIYDTADNLVHTITINYGDTYIGAEHIYLNNMLQYSFYGPKWGNSDTLFYFYNPNKQLDSIIEHDRDGASLFVSKTKFFYNSENKVIFCLSRLTNDSITYLIDSIFYSYTANNVTTVNKYIKHGSSPWDSLTLIITYDNKKNYYKTMGKPESSYKYWSENNIVQIIDAESSNVLTTINYHKYNESGYPTDFTLIELFQTEVQITYKCQ